MRAKILRGFSLMEMMVVLLIVAIIAAASAPMVTKKLSRNAGTGDSPWVFTGLNNSIAYNMNGNNNSAVIIGTVKRISYGSWTDLRFVPGAILSCGVLITVLSLLTVFKSSTPGLPPPLRQGEAVFLCKKL